MTDAATPNAETSDRRDATASAQDGQQDDPAQSQANLRSQMDLATSRYAGLQGRFKQTNEALDAANQQNVELLDRLIVAEGQAAGEDENAIGSARANLKNDLNLAEQQQALNDQEQRLQSVAAQLGPFIMDKEIQAKHGVSLQDLSNALGWEKVQSMAPQEMRTAAILLGKNACDNQAGARKNTGADQFEGGGGSVASNTKTWGVDTIKRGLERRAEAANKL